MTQHNPFEEIDTDVFASFFGMATKKVVADPTYRCVKCRNIMEVMLVDAEPKARKVFYCKKNACTQFGLLTVVAAKTN